MLDIIGVLYLNKFDKEMVGSLKAKRGFTLIEVLVVMGIVGILVAIAIPNFMGLIEKARKNTLINRCASIRSELVFWLTSASHREPVDGDLDGEADDCINEGGTLSACPPSTPPSKPAEATALAYINLSNNILKLRSPWDGRKSLFVYASDCNNSPARGQIVLCSETTHTLKMLCYDDTGRLLMSTILVTGD